MATMIEGTRSRRRWADGSSDCPADGAGLLLANRLPLGYDAGDANMYRYAWSNPGNWLDPSGMLPVPPGSGAKTRKWDPAKPPRGAKLLYKFSDSNAGNTEFTKQLEHPAVVLQVPDAGKLVWKVYSWEGGGSSDSSKSESSRDKKNRNGWNISTLDEYLEDHKDREIWLVDIPGVDNLKAQSLINREISLMGLKKTTSYDWAVNNCATQAIKVLNDAGARAYDINGGDFDLQGHNMPRDVRQRIKALGFEIEVIAAKKKK
jgi:hypothetical protein